jgi:benzoyl-CoA reductase/2-hydroxyglutaryl-CoA dehydratase subunit BcrC/BadD/HgdB
MSLTRTLTTVQNLRGWLPLLEASREEFAAVNAATVRELVAPFEAAAKALDEEAKMVGLLEFGLVPQLVYAFDCEPISLENFPVFMSRFDMAATISFLDAAHEAGVPSSVCSTDRFILGAALKNEIPDRAFFISSSAPCDGTRIAYPIAERLLGLPACFVEAPYETGPEAARWYGGQIREVVIPFLEKTTGRPFDHDRFLAVIEESNRAYELLLDINDMYATSPSPHTSSLRGMPYFGYVTSAGHPRLTAMLELFHDDLARRMAPGAVRNQYEEKHRIFWLHVTPSYADTLWPWLEKTFGATIVATTLTATPLFEPIDTGDFDSAVEGYARQGLEMTMSMMRYTTSQLIDQTMDAFLRFRCDCIIMTQHVGCNSITAASGMIRDYFRSRDIPIFFIELDYNDSRIVPVEAIKRQLEEIIMALES